MVDERTVQVEVRKSGTMILSEIIGVDGWLSDVPVLKGALCVDKSRFRLVKV